MKSKLAIGLAIVAILASAVMVSQAFGGHNSKSAFAGSTYELSYSNPSGGSNTVELGNATVKVSQKTDVVIALTAQSSLFTDTTVKGNNNYGTVSESSTAGITTWAIITPLDNQGNPIPGATAVTAFPGEVVLNKRIQTLSGKLSNVLINCVDPATGTIPTGCSSNTAEEIELKLDTTSANGFNFLAQDLDQGNYYIQVFATLDTNLLTVNQTTSSAPPVAAIGKRTIVVWEVKNPDSTLI